MIELQFHARAWMAGHQLPVRADLAGQIDKQLTTRFTRAQREKMWNAADQENDLRREGYWRANAVYRTAESGGRMTVARASSIGSPAGNCWAVRPCAAPSFAWWRRWKRRFRRSTRMDPGARAISSATWPEAAI